MEVNLSLRIYYTHLPKQSAPKYTCILPSDGREIEYRPFLVKEQKVLLLAQEQEDDGAYV